MFNFWIYAIYININLAVGYSLVFYYSSALKTVY